MTMDESKMNAKLARYQAIESLTDIINFKGSTLIKTDVDGFYVPMSSEEFARVVYRKYPGALKQQINELEHRFRVTAADFTDRAHLIAMGDKVWDAKRMEFVQGFDPKQAVFATRVVPDTGNGRAKAWNYMKELAVGDEDLAWDMLQGLAPLFMSKKPSGVIWFVGGGANGKSALLNAMYKIIGHHFTSMTVGAIEDGRDAPRLNGVLGNVCRESSEGKVEDTERYKAIGTHEPFFVHKFHSQEAVTITGDVHHIFNANNIPIFSDKTEGARRRTLIVPFNNHFKDDPNFEEKTFTPDFLAGLLQLVLEAAQRIAANRYQYKFSTATMAAKADYDSDVNSAEAFFVYLKEHGVEAFTNYHLLRMSYESWCANEGLIPLGVTNLKRAMKMIGGAERKTVRLPDGTKKWYFFDHSQTKAESLVSLDNGMHVGLKGGMPLPKVEAEQTKLGKEW